MITRLTTKNVFMNNKSGDTLREVTYRAIEKGFKYVLFEGLVYNVANETYEVVGRESDIINAKIHLSWDNVFNSQLIYPASYNKCREVAKARGYDYMSFNGRVYKVDDPHMDHLLIDDTVLETGVDVATRSDPDRVVVVPKCNLRPFENNVTDAVILLNNIIHSGDTDSYEEAIIKACSLLTTYDHDDIGKVKLGKYINSGGSNE